MQKYSTIITVQLNEKAEIHTLAPNQEIARQYAIEEAYNIFIDDGGANEMLTLHASNSIKIPPPTTTKIKKEYTSLRDLHSINTSNRLLKEKVSSENGYTRLFS